MSVRSPLFRPVRRQLIHLSCGVYSLFYLRYLYHSVIRSWLYARGAVIYPSVCLLAARHPFASCEPHTKSSMLLNIAALGLLVAPHRVSVHRASAQMGLYDLSATRIDGASVAMSDFKGKPLVVVVRKHCPSRGPRTGVGLS